MARAGVWSWAQFHTPALPPAACVILFGAQFPPLAVETLHAPGWAGITLLPPLPAALCPALRLSPSLCPSRSSVGCDQGPLDPAYLPAALELLDAPEHFRVQQVGHYPPANSSLGSRSETFLLLQPWPRAQPLLRASYPPFATQQVRRGTGAPRQTGLRAAVCCVRLGPAPAQFPEGETEARTGSLRPGWNWKPGLPSPHILLPHPCCIEHPRSPCRLSLLGSPSPTTGQSRGTCGPYRWKWR